MGSDLDRLACYDAAAGRNPEVSTISGNGRWIVRVEKSEMTDATNIYTHVESEEPITCRSWGQSERPRLYVRCVDDTTSVILATESCHLTSSNYHDYGDIQFRIDNMPAQTRGFVASTDSHALGLWNGGQSIPFVKSMFGRDTLLMKFTPYGESPRTVRFPIAGIEEAAKPLRKACKW